VARLRRELVRVKLDLNASKESMQSIVQDQEMANEELKSANEEVQSSNEELQSTNEELETAKEELQSTNEELTTLNEELQTRNVELGHLNNDLVNLLGSVNMAIIMVGQDLAIRRFTPTAERLFNLIPADLGRRLTDLKHTLLLQDLDQVVRQAIDELAVVERETQDGEGHWYLLRTRPYRTRDNKIDGAVIVLLDIDELRRALDLVMGMVHQPLVMLGADLKVRNANLAFLEAFKVQTDEVVGRFFYDINNRQWNIPSLRTLLEEVLPSNQQVRDFMVETPFPRIGLRKLRLNAARFFQEGRGMPLILLAIEDVTGK
jgi:two-component system CheB/CheR fusion protein